MKDADIEISKDNATAVYICKFGYAENSDEAKRTALCVYDQASESWGWSSVTVKCTSGIKGS